MGGNYQTESMDYDRTDRSRGCAGAGVPAFAPQANLNVVNLLVGLQDPSSPQRSESMLALNRIAGNHAVQRVVSVQRSTRQAPLPVQRDLEGIYEVLKGSGGKVKMLGGGNWTKLLEDTKKYERYEEEMHKLSRQMEGGDNKKLQDKMTAKQGKMEALLGKMQTRSQNWLGNREGNDNLSEQDQERQRLINSLAPRLTMAKRHMNDPIKARTDETLNEGESQNDWKGGQMKSLDKLAHNDGTTSIYTREQHQITEQQQSDQEEGIGVDRENPHYGARAVAMTELDKLLGTNLLVKTQFGTHKSRDFVPGGDPEGIVRPTMGIHMDEAKGDQFRGLLEDDTKSSFVGEEGSNKLSLTDPTLQRELNKLQFLDVLSGQVDLHMGNVHVDMDKNTGKVKGITGIDNDMAFGKNQTTLEPPKWGDGESKAPSWKGLPELVDSSMYNKLMRRSLRGHVSEALTGLLSEEEVDSTLSRLDMIQGQLGGYRPEQIIDDGGWNEETAKLQTVDNSYLGQARLEKYSAMDQGQISQMVGEVSGGYGMTNNQNWFAQPVAEDVRNAMVTDSINPTLERGFKLVQSGLEHLHTTMPVNDQRNNDRMISGFKQWRIGQSRQGRGGQQGGQNNAPGNGWVAPLPQNLPPPPQEWLPPPPQDWLNPPKQEEFLLDDFAEFGGMNHRRGFNMTSGFSLV